MGGGFARTLLTCTSCHHRLGRKILLFLSAGGMVLSLLSFGGYFYAKDVAAAAPPGWIPLLALMVYVVSVTKSQKKVFLLFK